MKGVRGWPRKHGMRETRLYNIWCGMKRRCLNKSDAAYPRYGGRGITICEEWIESFEPFMVWAMANGYDKKLTIDRKDNDKGYTPENCRWATYAQQNRNYSKNPRVTFEGRVVTILELAERFGHKPHTLRQRIQKMGWTVERAVATIAVRHGPVPPWVLAGKSRSAYYRMRVAAYTFERIKP